MCVFFPFQHPLKFYKNQKVLKIFEKSELLLTMMASSVSVVSEEDRNEWRDHFHEMTTPEGGEGSNGNGVSSAVLTLTNLQEALAR